MIIYLNQTTSMYDNLYGYFDDITIIGTYYFRLEVVFLIFSFHYSCNLKRMTNTFLYGKHIYKLELNPRLFIIEHSCVFLINTIYNIFVSYNNNNDT